MEKIQKDLNYLGEWAVENGVKIRECAMENGMKINPGKSKEIIFTSARVKNPMGLCLGDQKIP